mmetsp:Transcript_28885/g.40597  ORF Transcript_28885/g.40597 Transcript_28885/m.40597 type:complete len:82 (-) Transcript_28885:66-311(-)
MYAKLLKSSDICNGVVVGFCRIFLVLKTPNETGRPNPAVTSNKGQAVVKKTREENRRIIMMLGYDGCNQLIQSLCMWQIDL